MSRSQRNAEQRAGLNTQAVRGNWPDVSFLLTESNVPDNCDVGPTDQRGIARLATGHIR